MSTYEDLLHDARRQQEFDRRYDWADVECLGCGSRYALAVAKADGEPKDDPIDGCETCGAREWDFV